MLLGSRLSGRMSSTLGMAFLLVGSAIAVSRAGAPSPAPRSDEAATAKDVDILNEERNLRAIRAERLNREVLRTIETVRKQFTEAPDAALSELKRALAAVVASH